MLEIRQNMNMVLLDSDDMRGDGFAKIDGGRGRHIRSVLKSRVGDSIRIGLLNGPRGVGRIEAIDAKSVQIACEFNTEIPPRPRIDLILAMPRPKVLARLWPQLSALGVGTIVILKAEKVERSYLDSHVLKPEFIDARLRAGLQQACCTHMPRVLIRPKFKPFVEDELDAIFPKGIRIVSDPYAESSLAGALAAQDSQVKLGRGDSRVLFAIGPEGGWNEYELSLFSERDFAGVGLGPRILQSDTACIALMAMASQFLDECVDI